MANLIATLRSSTSALETITQAVGVTQNNISNVGTPGYAKQRVSLQALAFDPRSGLAGGVGMGPVQTFRDQYVENSVRLQNSKASAADARSTSLTKLEQTLQLSAGDSIPTALNGLYSAFSAWAVAPGEAGSKQNVLFAAQKVADSFRGIANELDGLARDNASEIGSIVERVNRLAGRVKEYNASVRAGASEDSGLDASLHASLDELSADINMQAVRQSDGTYALLLAGEHPVVLGEAQYELKASFQIPANPPPQNPGATPGATLILDGQDVTGLVDGGRLGAALEFRHTNLAAVIGDSQNKGQLETLADKVMTRINETWPSPAPAFFVATGDSVARTIAVNPALTPAALQANEPGPPAVANGKALQLAALANPTAANDKLDGMSFTEYYGSIATKVGRSLTEAKFDRQSQAQILSQAQAFRERISAVSIDEEAINLIQFQRAYQASARMVTTLDEMLETAVNLGRS